MYTLLKVVGGAECQRQKGLGLVKIVHYLIKIHGYRLESNKSWALSNRAMKKFKIDKFEWSEHFPGTEPKFEIVIPKDVKKKPLAEHVQVGSEVLMDFSRMVIHSPDLILAA